MSQQREIEVERSRRLQGVRVLVAEDNHVNQDLLLDILERAGISADIAADGKQALASVERERYDLVLMDCQMPVKDGLAATREIRELNGERAQIPIVALTAHAMRGDRERCLEAGMDDYLTKPIDRDVLLGKIAEMAQRFR